MERGIVSERWMDQAGTFSFSATVEFMNQENRATLQLRSGYCIFLTIFLFLVCSTWVRSSPSSSPSISPSPGISGPLFFTIGNSVWE
jgi:hypothetical protein